MTSPANAFKQLQLLRQAFFDLLPARIVKIEAGWHDVAGGAWNIAAAKELHLLLHNLTGSAGTFGLPDVSQLARTADLELEALLTAHGDPTHGQLEAMTMAIAELRQAAAIEQPKPLSPLMSATASLKKLVYLIDDDNDFTQDMVRSLGYFSYEVRTFGRPEALRTALQREMPAVILIDIMFPDDAAGIAAVQELRHSHPGLPPLVFISAREDFEARLGAVRAGCSAYFTKPIDIGAMVDCLDRLTRVQPREPHRVLIVDDSPQEAAAYALALHGAGIETNVVADPMTVTAKLADFMPDLILMDVNMPQCTGIELAAAIRQLGAYLSIPIVFLSAETNRDRQLSAMREGGDDFLTKPIKTEHLVASVLARVERARTIRSFMLRDSLTGLFNHTRIKEQLATEVARARRGKTDLAFAIIDFDHFKSVNDTCGHPVGDRVIKSVARLLQQRLRSTDIIGRYGGDEFAVILPGTHADQAREVLDNIRASFHALRHHSAHGEFASSFSCGVAVFNKFDSTTLLLDAAGRALYEAKQAGRNRVVIAEIPRAQAGVTA